MFKIESDFLYGQTITGHRPDINGLIVYVNQKKNLHIGRPWRAISNMTCTMVKLSYINPRNHGYASPTDLTVDLSSPESILQIQKYFNDAWKECQPRYAWAAPLGLTTSECRAGVK